MHHHSYSTGVFLPEELVTEILLRLPVKSILLVASVCRLWHTIIRSQRFIRDQVRYQESNPTTGLLLYYGRYPDRYIPRARRPNTVPGCLLFPDATLQISEELDSRMLPEGPIVSMEGPCNGIVCLLRRDYTFAFWNPATRGLREVPLCPHKEFHSYRDFGFGIDPLTDALKIVLIKNIRCHGQFAMYNSRDDSWRLYEDKIFSRVISICYRSCKSSNRFSYWIMCPDETMQVAILVFDMHNNSFQQIDVPVNILKLIENGYTPKLDFYNDALALVVYSKTTVEIWFMKERGSWEKLSSACLSFIIYEPIAILSKNEIVVGDASNDLIIYGTDSHHTRKLEYRNWFQNPDVSVKPDVFVRPYKETLAPV